MIGVFDSGFGGLTILQSFIDELPAYDFTYLGDNGRTPYGNKSLNVIYEYTRQAVEFLFGFGAGLIILACNTASAKALRKIQQEWLSVNYPDRRVLGVVIPLAEAAVEASKSGRIGVIGTRATIESRVYDQELNKLREGLGIFSQACPLLVPLVEENWVGKPETTMILKKYLRPLKTKNIDTLILGCTHYPFLKNDIKRIMGKNCHVLDAPGIVAGKLADYLKRHPEIDGNLSKDGKRVFYTTDGEDRFRSFGRKFFGKHISNVRTTTLE
ncbi:Glutamate racemase [uncultured Desulfobacterium sp.]|uniref:Glutamate racemase n=1 Tax=uncultured Desulfobacterium sp. TaxID=201089 RepID=A0A445N1H1_9BACT|nr:Glutamate racemase [uncultured Desulfobacterium sp.]